MENYNLSCFDCHKEYQIKDIPNPKTGNGHKCDCGGYVVSPSGKIIIVFPDTR